MSTPTSAESVPEDPPTPRWSPGEVLLAALVSFITSIVLGGIVLAAAGARTTDDVSLKVIAVIQATLWLGMLGSVLVVLRLRHGELRRDLGLRFKLIDVPIGVVLGVAGQLLLVPAASWPWIKLLGADADELKEPACRLADKANDSVGVALLFLITVIGAPIVEELFFRGFAQRAFVARLGRVAGVVATAFLFGLVHFQLLQLPALVMFGLLLGVLADRFGRLGPGIVTHMAFNATTVVSLVVLSSSVDEECGAVLGALLR